MARGTTRNVTIREGTSEKYWYTLAGYLAVVGLGILYAGGTMVSSFGSSNFETMTGTSVGLVIVGASLLGLVVYPALFKDAAYVRSTSHWSPKWWYYIAGGFLTPVAVFFVISAASITALGGVLAVIVHGFSASAASGLYLYRRHQHVGVP
jgi:hypothetical protein